MVGARLTGPPLTPSACRGGRGIPARVSPEAPRDPPGLIVTAPCSPQDVISGPPTTVQPARPAAAPKRHVTQDSGTSDEPDRARSPSLCSREWSADLDEAEPADSVFETIRHRRRGHRVDLVLRQVRGPVVTGPLSLDPLSLDQSSRTRLALDTSRVRSSTWRFG